MKRALWVVGVVLWASCAQAWAQDGAYTFSAGLSSWGTSAGAGLLGMSAEVEQQGMAAEAFLGIGTNRVQGWALWPRVYLVDGTWRPFGELALVQISETELSVDPNVGLKKTTYTWQFMGLGIGIVYAQHDRVLRASVGLGVTGGQCLFCGMAGYAALHLGFAI